MQENKINMQYISYEQLKQMQEHAIEYNVAFDKINFLRNVSPYEQKIILLQALKPYEVLNNLNKIDSKNTRLVLDSLTYDEIKNIINLFSSEDKKSFYTNFSDLDLVNQFIKQDTNSNNYIKDLTFDRKVELINNTDSKTIEATNEIYQSMTSVEQEKVSTAITASSAVSAVSEVSDNDARETIEIPSKETEDLENNQEIQQLEETKEEQIEETEELKEESQDQAIDLKNEFLKTNLQYYTNNKEFSNLTLEEINYLNLPESLKIIIDKDYNLYQEALRNKEENQDEILEKFNNEKENCERDFINKVVNDITNEDIKIIEEETIQFQKVI